MNFAIGGHIHANGIRQHYLHYAGNGTRVVIVPGIVTPAVLWDHVGRWLAPGRDCYVLDVRGRGLSESGSHLDYGLDDCARDVAAFVREMHLGAVTLIGHSMGARILLRTANEAPDVVRSLVLVDPPTSGPGRRPYPIPIKRTLALLAAAIRGDAATAIRKSGAVAWPESLQRLRAEWLPTCDERAVLEAYHDFHRQDMFADLASIKVPVSLICAGEGGVVSEADVEEMRRILPDLYAVRLAGAGHQMQAEDSAGFCGLLDDALCCHDQSIMRSEK